MKDKKEKRRAFLLSMASLLHGGIFFLSVLAFLGCFLVWLIRYGSLPEEIGVHFDGSGRFDVYDHKAYGFYPFIVNFIALVLIRVFTRLCDSPKMKMDPKLTLFGNNLMKAIFVLFLDCEAFVTTAIFSGTWSVSVLNQVPMDRTTITRLTLVWIMILPLAAIISGIAVAVIHRKGHGDEVSPEKDGDDKEE